MRILLLAGASLLVLSTPALAQDGEQLTTPTNSDSPIDTLVGDETATTAPAVIAPTGDPVLDRFNALEARIKQLEGRNAQLEQQAELNEERIQSVETRSAKAAQFTWAPTISEPTGQFTFKPRGVIEADVVLFNERKGGYDYNNGTGLRRARIGLEGTAFKWFNYRIEADFAGNAVNLTDAYLQYTKIPKTVLPWGSTRRRSALESNNSDITTPSSNAACSPMRSAMPAPSGGSRLGGLCAKGTLNFAAACSATMKALGGRAVRW